MIAYCGLDCAKCDAYLATIENSDIKRKTTAQKWSNLYQHEIKPEHIHCDGCKSNGDIFFHCSHCEIRRCGFSKNLAHCAECKDYICGDLAGFIKLAPEAGLSLEKLRQELKTGPIPS